MLDIPYLLLDLVPEFITLLLRQALTVHYVEVRFINLILLFLGAALNFIIRRVIVLGVVIILDQVRFFCFIKLAAVINQV